MPVASQRGPSSESSAGFASGAALASGAEARGSLWLRSGAEDVTPTELQKFWDSLSFDERRDLLRIDKQTLFEQVRKNLYCSRCHGLLVEGYAQITLYGKGQQGGSSKGSGGSNGYVSGGGSGRGVNGTHAALYDDTDDPLVHPWGGLAATRDSMLTLLDCFLRGTPIQVFHSARAREKERESLYPDACGGNGRGWISQNTLGSSGRGHTMKESCALHTARLSCEALVDFWSALGEETRKSLLRMKEEDFIERLMFRFENKRFCRDCRRNVLREFKELKELKRMRKDPRCTPWFCAADTAFRYEVTDHSLSMDWRECFLGDAASLYQKFEWALGTAEGKGDILPFEDVGLSESVHVDGLDLGGRAVCFLTVRGWKRDGRSSELWAKACAVKGQLCVHRRLLVGDGHVSITKGESIQRFFERAEEAEEEEEEEALDKEGNELDGDGLRPQKHAKSPELARDFLLDAATVIFKEQVEKAFREGTARQNAHSIFVCLALSLLEERVRVACKEISALEKQNKLLEEEEDEKREEEERRERRKQKEKERKQRRKEKLKGKEKCKAEEDTGKGETYLVAGKSKENGPLPFSVSSAVASWPSSGKTSIAGSDDEEEHGSGDVNVTKGREGAEGAEVNGNGVEKSGDDSGDGEEEAGNSGRDSLSAEEWERDSLDATKRSQGGISRQKPGIVISSPGKRVQGKKGLPKPVLQATKPAFVVSVSPSKASLRPSAASISASGNSTRAALPSYATNRPGRSISGAESLSLASVTLEQATTSHDEKGATAQSSTIGKGLHGKNGVKEGSKLRDKSPVMASGVEECACGKSDKSDGNRKNHPHSCVSDVEIKVQRMSLEGSKNGINSAGLSTSSHTKVFEPGLVRSGPGPGPGPGAPWGPSPTKVQRGAISGGDKAVPSVSHNEGLKAQLRGISPTVTREPGPGGTAQLASSSSGTSSTSGLLTSGNSKGESLSTAHTLQQTKVNSHLNAGGGAWSGSGGAALATVLASEWPPPGMATFATTSAAVASTGKGVVGPSSSSRQQSSLPPLSSEGVSESEAASSAQRMAAWKGGPRIGAPPSIGLSEAVTSGVGSSVRTGLSGNSTSPPISASAGSGQPQPSTAYPSPSSSFPVQGLVRTAVQAHRPDTPVDAKLGGNSIEHGIAHIGHRQTGGHYGRENDVSGNRAIGPPQPLPLSMTREIQVGLPTMHQGSGLSSSTSLPSVVGTSITSAQAGAVSSSAAQTAHANLPQPLTVLETVAENIGAAKFGGGDIAVGATSRATLPLSTGGRTESAAEPIQRPANQGSAVSSHTQLGGHPTSRDERSNTGLQYRGSPPHGVSPNPHVSQGIPSKGAVHSRMPLPPTTVGGQGVLPVPSGHAQMGMSGAAIGAGGLMGPPNLSPGTGLNPGHRPGNNPQAQGQPMGFYQARSPQWAPRGRNGMLPIPTLGGVYIPAAGNGRLGMVSTGLPVGGGLRHTATTHPVHVPDGVPGLVRPPSSSAHMSHMQSAFEGGGGVRQTTARPSGEAGGATPLHSLAGHGSDGGAMAVGLSRAALSVQSLPVEAPSERNKPTTPDPVSFSLFHFGGPAPVPVPQVGMGTPASGGTGGEEGGSDREQHHVGQERGPHAGKFEDMGAARPRVLAGENCEVNIGEYSLFSSGAGKSFGFF